MSRLDDLRGAACAVCRPIPDAELPRLGEQVTLAANPSLLVALVFTPGAPVFALTAVMMGKADPIRAMIIAPLVALIFILNNRWARSEHGKVHFNGPLLVTAIGITVGFTGMAWVSGRALEHILPLIVVVPAMIAMFVPWKPVFAVASTFFAIASVVAGGAFIHGGFLWPDPLMLAVAVCIGGASAVGQQITRLHWLAFERAKTQLLASDRMSSLGRMTAGIAHELKTPLAALQNGFESAASLTDELGRSIGHQEVTVDDLREITSELAETLATLRTSADRAISFVQAIRNHGSTGVVPGRRAPFRVADRLSEVLTFLSFRIRNSRVRVELRESDEGAVVFGDAAKLDQVITNLVSNALDACEESGEGTSVLVSGRVVGGRVVIAVEDDGPGVPSAVAEHIFDSLFTTRVDGTGLGLPISRDLMRAEFGGDLCLAPSGRGARFEASCPAAGG